MCGRLLPSEPYDFNVEIAGLFWVCSGSRDASFPCGGAALMAGREHFCSTTPSQGIMRQQPSDTYPLATRKYRETARKDGALRIRVHPRSVVCFPVRIDLPAFLRDPPSPILPVSPARHSTYLVNRKRSRRASHFRSRITSLAFSPFPPVQLPSAVAALPGLAPGNPRRLSALATRSRGFQERPFHVIASPLGLPA